MRIIDLLTMCFRNLFRRKVRTILTVLGVVIGTCSIVVMMSLGVGLNQNFEAEMATYMDVTSIMVNVPSDVKSGKKVVLDDKAIKKFSKIENVQVVSPIMSLMDVAEIAAGRYTYRSQVIAMDLSTMKEFGYKTTEGALMESGAPNNGIYFGYAAPWQFVDSNTNVMPDYPTDDKGHYTDPPPINVMTEQLTIAPINNSTANTQGQGEGTGQSSTSTNDTNSNSGGSDTGSGNTGNNSSSEPDKPSLGQSQALSPLGLLKEDYAKEGAAWGVIIPLELGQQLQKEFNAMNGIQSPGNKYDIVKIKVDTMDNVAQAESEIKAMGYQTESAQQFRDAMAKQANLIQLVLGGLGAISLFVAALGITNTMIMSIYERTREIGVMKVLGCSLNDIRAMFLVEAGSIGFIGGVLGIIFSYIISFVVNSVVAMMGGGALSMKISIIPVWLILLGMGFSVGVGLISGFSPANRAVKISPLAAIRQE
ncbi:MAG: ABC transporter permease [Clostridiales bacterium]